MGRRLVIVGCIGVIFLLMLTTFSSVVCAQKEQLNEKQTNVFQQIKNKLWQPGDIIDTILVLLIAFIMITNAFFSGHYG